MENRKDKWWKKYIEADILERQNLIAELPLVKELARNGFPNIDNPEKQEEFNSHMLTSMFMSYIDDMLDMKEEKKIKVKKYDKIKKIQSVSHENFNILKYCRLCKKEIDHPRRGMCLNCYRKKTGLSKSQKL